MFWALAVSALVLVGNSWWQLVTAVVFGIAFTQTAFIGHDAGHQQVFARRRANDLLGLVAGDLFVGLSYGWWLDKHNRHHANPNREDHDPDIGEGVLAFTTSQAEARSGRVARAFTRRQAWLFFPLLTLEGLNLHMAGVRSLRNNGGRSARGGHRSVEITLLAVHVGVYLAAVFLVMSPGRAVAFVVLHQAVFGLYMGCSFAPNHKGMPIIGADERVDFLRRQVLTSRNVRGGVGTDLLLGGLNYQVEHHLFPNMPRSALRHAQVIVRTYCHERQITYTETSLLDSYRATLRHLDRVGSASSD